jgi:hypothetical protein
MPYKAASFLPTNYIYFAFNETELASSSVSDEGFTCKISGFHGGDYEE